MFRDVFDCGQEQEAGPATNATQPDMLRPRGCLSLHPFRPQYRRFMSVFSSKRLENKTVLVTGASAGIGEVSIHTYLSGRSDMSLGNRYTLCKSEHLILQDGPFQLISVQGWCKRYNCCSS